MKAEFGLVATDINAACSEAVVIHDVYKKQTRLYNKYNDNCVSLPKGFPSLRCLN